MSFQLKDASALYGTESSVLICETTGGKEEFCYDG